MPIITFLGYSAVLIKDVIASKPEEFVRLSRPIKIRVLSRGESVTI